MELQSGQYGTALVNLVDTLYFNQEAPRNNNIKIKHIRNQEASVWTGTGWEDRNLKVVMKQVFTHVLSLCQNEYTSIECPSPRKTKQIVNMLINSLRNYVVKE
jgi:hypothetical protein